MSGLAVFGPIAVLAAAFLGYCFTELVRRPAKALPKAVWALIILAQIPGGGIVYLIVGRGEHEAAEPGGVGERAGTGAWAVPGLPAQRATMLPGSTAVLSTRALTRVYPGGGGIREVDLVIPQRGVYGLVGPNGSGKTTLLSVLAGLRRAQSGRIEPGPGGARVLLCPDAPAFEPWLTATETIALFTGLSRGSFDSSAGAGADVRFGNSVGVGRDRGLSPAEALDAVGLGAVRHRPVGGFSRGMAQRLGLAVGLASGAPVLLLDEPTSALDPQGRTELLDLVAEVGRRRAAVFSSHILADVERVADTVGVLRAGRLLYQGPLDELLAGSPHGGWRIRLRSGAVRLAQQLRGLDWVTDVAADGLTGADRPASAGEAGAVRDGGELLVRTRSRAEGEALLPARIAASGAELVSFQPVGADLEAVFFALLGGAAASGIARTDDQQTGGTAGANR